MLLADDPPRCSLAFVYKRIQNYYLATSRELKRLDATTKSPIFAAFQVSRWVCTHKPRTLN